MMTIGTDTLGITAAADGAEVRVTDVLRHCQWVWRSDGATFMQAGEQAPRPLGRPTILMSTDTMEVVFTAGGGTVSYVWSVEGDSVVIRLRCDAPQIESVCLPGAFAPAEGTARAAVPVYQGLLLRGSGHTWRRRVGHGGHEGFTMAMGAMLGDRGGLLVVHDSPCNWMAWYGQNASGPAFGFEHLRCPVEGWVDASVRLFAVDADVTAACKRYRRRVIEQGNFVSWSEKIARKPLVKELFGALIAFIGYNHDDSLDYAASAAALHSQGFESVFYYPARMCSYTLNFLMGGDKPIWLSDAQIEAMRAVPGAHLSPWGWTFEGLDDGSEAMRSIFRHNESGPAAGWKIGEFQWYQVCTPYQIEHIRKRFAGDMAAMDWIHYDVSASVGGRPCLTSGHATHGNGPLGRRGDTQWIRRLFDPETVGNRVVSSEGFGDHFAGHYDIGSTKCMPLWGGAANCVPIPMTMLVFHDSCIHDWWELHNYNTNPGFGLQPLPEGVALTGAGLPQLKAAMDALYGCPPNVFPFGRQYAWVDKFGGDTFAFTIRPDDPSVEEALAAALPVARLHGKIGQCEMTSWESLSDDDAVQRTVFADGTAVVANLGDAPCEIAGCERLIGHSWRLTN